MNLSSRPTSPPSERRARALLLVLAVVVAGCGGEATPDGDEAPRSGPASAPAVATLDLGPDTYRFDRVSCDLDDRVPDDLLLQATGTAPEGRRVHLEVERREVGGLIRDRVSVSFGSIVDGDQWSATASALPDGGWATSPAGGEPLDGPLVVIEGDELRAAGRFRHETRDEAREGGLLARCAG
ncbi:MAG: hypothetical protein Q8W51_02230 [Candidatus Palauibacterales bacterium]|nr:hypothetical protein [Candidatus Palauibacterales bacterium]MDP2528540.1 hypothetical protein [Candidatus Palauibacterales bacterium]MDP2584770.1 hypothetical protein [Candidatus Palauibacterales bacterium]